MENEIDYDNLSEMEKSFNLPKNSLKSIPIYARIHAADAIAKVMEMERKSLFNRLFHYNWGTSYYANFC